MPPAMMRMMDPPRRSGIGRHAVDLQLHRPLNPSRHPPQVIKWRKRDGLRYVDRVLLFESSADKITNSPSSGTMGGQNSSRINHSNGRNLKLPVLEPDSHPMGECY
jgi:hypothetical protein